MTSAQGRNKVIMWVNLQEFLAVNYPQSSWATKKERFQHVYSEFGIASKQQQQQQQVPNHDSFILRLDRARQRKCSTTTFDYDVNRDLRETKSKVICYVYDESEDKFQIPMEEIDFS